MVLSSLRIGYLQFPPAALGLLLVAVAVSRGLRRISARWGLSSSDLLVIYVMMLVGAMASSHGIVQKWIPLLRRCRTIMPTRQQLAGPVPAPPAPLAVPDGPARPGKRPVARWYYEKLPRGGSVPWEAWVVPVLRHRASSIGLIVFAFLCLAAILRRQWVDNEKLSFPLAQLPLEIAGDEERRRSFPTGSCGWARCSRSSSTGSRGCTRSSRACPDVPMQWT